MNGKTVIITGATGGIGKETTKELATKGARVIMACRNVDAAKKLRDEIVEITKNENIIVKKLDISSQKSIREFAEDIIRTEPKLDVLLHNAATCEKKCQKNEDGVELTMATNYFGPFLLTHLLIDLLKRSSPSRVVIVASELYRLSCLNLDKINPSSSWFPQNIYWVSKYANICFTLELARRLEGTKVTANCLHPGLIDTGIWDSTPIIFSWPMKLIAKTFFKTSTQGCQTSVFAACSEELENVTGKYFSDCAERGLSSGATDVSKAKKLWELSETIVNLRPTDPKI
ncbi:hypothetical protein JTB14_001088 [Gonioctena quinquepunctata]|nr:hypothetical protein JTB14_001088 [Gonioctena quinquepunctata]